MTLCDEIHISLMWKPTLRAWAWTVILCSYSFEPLGVMKQEFLMVALLFLSFKYQVRLLCYYYPYLEFSPVCCYNLSHAMFWLWYFVEADQQEKKVMGWTTVFSPNSHCFYNKTFFKFWDCTPLNFGWEQKLNVIRMKVPGRRLHLTLLENCLIYQTVLHFLLWL